MLGLVLRESELFENLDRETFDKVLKYLSPRISFVRVSPGQILFEQGDRANALYFVRLGHVRVGLLKFGAEAKVLSRGPGAIIGEIGLARPVAQGHEPQRGRNRRRRAARARKREWQSE